MRGDQEVIANLALRKSPTDAAEAAGAGRSTVDRRLEDPEFRQQVIGRRAVSLDERTSRGRTLAMDSCWRTQM